MNKRLAQLVTLLMVVFLVACPGTDPISDPIPDPIPDQNGDLTESLIEGTISHSGVAAGDVMVVVQNVATGNAYQVVVAASSWTLKKPMSSTITPKLIYLTPCRARLIIMGRQRTKSGCRKDWSGTCAWISGYSRKTV